jgi:hypothetical protein
MAIISKHLSGCVLLLVSRLLHLKPRGKTRIHRVITTLVFFLFGLSDIVEVQTGAWWSPWWLFVWKVSCGLSMIILLWLYLRDRALSK